MLFQPGELELTFMCSSTREANLQALLEDNSEVHSHVGDLVEVYKGILAKDVRGTHLAHMTDTVHLTQKTAGLLMMEIACVNQAFPMPSLQRSDNSYIASTWDSGKKTPRRVLLLLLHLPKLRS